MTTVNPRKKTSKRSRKKAPRRASNPHRPPEPKKKVDQAIRKIRKRYQAGEASLRKDHQAGGRNRDEKIPAEIYKARNFANTFRPDELDEMIRLCEKHERAIPINFTERLSGIKNKKERKKLTAQAIRVRWSTQTLNTEIRKRFGRQKQAGRKPRRPTDPQAALSQIFEMCVTFTRWGQSAGWNFETGRFVSETEDDIIQQLPEPVYKELQKALRSVRDLQQAAENALPSYH